VVIAYGQKLSRPLVDGVFAINLHASLLPRWRGAAPINAAILAGDETTGNSVITLAQRMDAGLILGQSTRPIPPDLTAGELHDVLSADGPDLVERVLAQWRSGALGPREQDESQVTKARKLSRDDAWNLSAMA
jgi:methionyl-tRNA formyltransferase